jgi:hypothetical protein
VSRTERRNEYRPRRNRPRHSYLAGDAHLSFWRGLTGYYEGMMYYRDAASAFLIAQMAGLWTAKLPVDQIRDRSEVLVFGFEFSELSTIFDLDRRNLPATWRSFGVCSGSIVGIADVFAKLALIN